MALGIFANCVFFVKVNHLPVQDKKRLKTCIKENGGIISFVLNKKCTHVIVEHTGVLGSRHLQNIKNNHIPILRADFIWKCVEEKLLLKTDDYCHNIACEIVAEKETHNKDKDNNQILQETTEKNTKKIDKKRIYIESDPDLPNFHQDFEVAKYAALEKTLENLPKEVAVIELQCLKGQVDSPFQLEIQMGLSNGVQKKQNYLQFDTSEQACEKYHVYIEDLKKKGFKLRKGIPKEAVHLASEKLQELLLQDEINATSVSQEISTFVELIWVEALGHLDHILCHPVNSISLNDVSKGEGILLQVRKALDNGETMDTLITIMSEFYRIIPHKHGLDYTINKKLLSTKQDLCQLIRDIVSVCETNMSRSNPPSLAKYHALRCMIEHISPSSEEFLQVKQQVLEKNHSNSPLKVLNIYRVGRLGEAAQFESNLGNVQSLLHASTASNYVGILSRGLLLPKIVVEDHGVDRTDIGNLGSGIYFSDSISTSLKYSAPTKTDGSRLLVVCDVALGNCLDLHRKDYSLTNAPSGFHSVHGIRKTPGVFADFEDDEFVVYKTSQVKIKYIVNFCTTEDHIEEFCPDVHVAASEEMLSNPSDVPVQPEETLTDIKPLDEITGGLLDLSGNQIPLEGVYIKGKIIDFIAQVVVFQTYRNQCTVPIEAKYVFPLDSTSAVCGFEAFINGKHIIGKVKEKQQAHREYREAISQGHGAYLMDQDAADVFTVSVGNLPPKATVFIKITYITELKLMYGSMVFEVPGAVAPWQQDNALNENTQDTVEKVCVTGAGAEKGAFSLDLSVEMPFTISGIWSRTHSIKMKKTDCKAVVTTAKNSSLEIYGFSLMIDLSEPYLPRMWVERHPDKESEACMLVFQPDFDTDSDYDELEFNEIIICLDCSNSMSSVLQQAKKIALLAVNTFNFESKLNIIKFGTRYEEFSSYGEGVIDKEPLEKFIKSAKPTMGNTDLWKLLHSLSLLAPCKGIRNILLISDGHIQEESRTFQIIKNNVKHTRLFTCGVGPTANRHMLRSLSQYGGGAFEYFDANSKYNWKSKVAAQLSRTEYAGCNSVSVKWQQFNADAPEPVQAPAHIQSVFNTEKVLVYGFVPHCTQATLHALLHNQEINTMVSTTELQKTTGTILHKLTAKALIRDYEDGILHEKESEHEMKKQMLKSMIIELSKEYSIVTQFTSFVAIEQRDTNESQADMLNIQDLLAVEDVDFLPYMTWEKDIHSRRKRRKANMSNDMEPTCDVPLSDSSANIMETDEEPLIGGKLDMLTCEQPTCELYDVILASDEEPLSDSMLDMTVIDMLPTSASEGDAIYDDDEEDAECSSALRRPTFTGKSDMPVFFTKMMSAPSAGIYALKSPKSASPLSETQPPPPPPPPAPQASQPLAAALFRCRSEEISFESVPPPSGVFLPESMLQPIAGEQRRIEREGFVQLNLEEQHDRFDLAFSETSRRVAQKPDSVSYQHDSVIVPRFPLPGSTLFDIRKSPSTSAGFIGMSFPTASSASRRQEASSEATATEYSMFVPQAPPIFTNNVLLRSMPFSSSAATAPVQREIDKVTVIGFGSSSSVSGSSMFGVPPCGEAFKRKPHFRALRKKSSFQRVTSEMPSWSALFLLQTPNHYWELSPELGTALNVNVSYLINVFLVQKGLQSLGLKGREEVLQLIATLLVLQAMYFTQKQGEITFKSLMKLDESSIKNDFYFRLQKVMEWARNVDRQYPAICSRLGLGKDWNSATRQLLGVDPIEANSSLDKAFLHC